MFFNLLQKLRRDESGATMVEYSVLVGLITVALVALVFAVGGQITGAWTNLTAALTAGGL